MTAPDRIWAYAGSFKMWRDHKTDADHVQTEYTRSALIPTLLAEAHAEGRREANGYCTDCNEATIINSDGRGACGHGRVVSMRQLFTALLDTPTPTPAQPSVQEAWCGKNDKNGRRICVGDIVQFHNENKNTKPEYWNPFYRLHWEAPSFVLRHVGGGKSSGNMDFILRNYPDYLEIIEPDALASGDQP